jgi:hypothetical protein
VLSRQQAWDRTRPRRGRSFNALRWELHKLLGRRPWQHHVIDDLGEPPERDEDKDWAGAVALRRRLDAVAS